MGRLRLSGLTGLYWAALRQTLNWCHFINFWYHFINFWCQVWIGAILLIFGAILLISWAILIACFFLVVLIFCFSEKKFSETKTKTFFKTKFYERDQILRNWNRGYFLETNFPKPKPRLFSETKFSETNPLKKLAKVSKQKCQSLDSGRPWC